MIADTATAEESYSIVSAINEHTDYGAWPEWARSAASGVSLRDYNYRERGNCAVCRELLCPTCGYHYADCEHPWPEDVPSPFRREATP